MDRLVSKNPDNRNSFGVIAEIGYTLTLAGNNKTAIFIIGSKGPGPNTFYLRSSDSNEVYQASGALYDKLAQPLDSWKKK